MECSGSTELWMPLIATAFFEPAHCAFMIVTYCSSRGDVGYLLNVKDFLDVPK